jgi:hypothetical protein
MLHILRHAGGDVTVNGDVQDFPAIEFLGENHGTGFSRDPLNHTLALQSTKVTHGGSLAGKSEEVLELTGGGHNAGLALRFPQVVKNLLLAMGKGQLHFYEQCSKEQTATTHPHQAKFQIIDRIKLTTTPDDRPKKL